MSHRSRRRSVNSARSSARRTVSRRRGSSSRGLSPAQISLRDFRVRQTLRRRSVDGGSFMDKVRTMPSAPSPPSKGMRDLLNPFPSPRVPARRRRVPNAPSFQNVIPSFRQPKNRSRFMAGGRFIG